MLGPLATHAEPHSYDLCAEHAERLTAPRGWEVVRLAPELIPAGPTPDDLVALAEAVREARWTRPLTDTPAERPTAESYPVTAPRPEAAPRPEPEGGRQVGRRGHLRVLRGEAD